MTWITQSTDAIFKINIFELLTLFVENSEWFQIKINSAFYIILVTSKLGIRNVFACTWLQLKIRK